MGDTPLLRVIKNSFVPHDRYESAKILLLHGAASGEGDCDERQTPLKVAVKLGDVDMCDVLIRVGGLDPRSVLTRHSDGRMVFKDDASSEKPDMETTLRLLRKHANTASMMANSMAPAKQHFGIHEARQEGDAALVESTIPERHGQLVCLAQGCSTAIEKTTRPVGY
ncbi:ankyrin repeat domain-containing protein [Candidatus Bathyarchaeota archaeon]|nr:ankyrin repeat domain-containing protein [Candidatus Bathyarchaeota archaeon]